MMVPFRGQLCCTILIILATYDKIDAKNTTEERVKRNHDVKSNFKLLPTSQTRTRLLSQKPKPIHVPPYAVKMEPLVQYSQRDPLFHDQEVTFNVTNIEHNDKSKIDTVAESTNHFAEYTAPAPAPRYTAPAPHFESYPHHYYKEPEPIIEIIIKESNESLPTVPPTTVPTPKPTKEPIQVFYVKYKKKPSNGYGPGGKEEVIYEEPVPALTPVATDIVDHNPVTEPYYPPSYDNPAPPPPSTTYRTIIRPDSEIYHGSGLKVTFGKPEDPYSSHSSYEHRSSSVPEAEKRDSNVDQTEAHAEIKAPAQNNFKPSTPDHKSEFKSSDAVKQKPRFADDHNHKTGQISQVPRNEYRRFSNEKNEQHIRSNAQQPRIHNPQPPGFQNINQQPLQFEDGSYERPPPPAFHENSQQKIVFPNQPQPPPFRPQPTVNFNQQPVRPEVPAHPQGQFHQQPQNFQQNNHVPRLTQAILPQEYQHLQQRPQHSFQPQPHLLTAPQANPPFQFSNQQRPIPTSKIPQFPTQDQQFPPAPNSISPHNVEPDFQALPTQNNNQQQLQQLQHQQSSHLHQPHQQLPQQQPHQQQFPEQAPHEHVKHQKPLVLKPVASHSNPTRLNNLPLNNGLSGSSSPQHSNGPSPIPTSNEDLREQFTRQKLLQLQQQKQQVHSVSEKEKKNSARLNSETQAKRPSDNPQPNIQHYRDSSAKSEKTRGEFSPQRALDDGQIYKSISQSEEHHVVHQPPNFKQSENQRPFNYKQENSNNYKQNPNQNQQLQNVKQSEHQFYVNPKSVQQFNNKPPVQSFSTERQVPKSTKLASSSREKSVNSIASSTIKNDAKKEKDGKSLPSQLAALPAEVPDDLREQLLSSGILSNADIQILDYDKVGDIPIENLPPEALESLYGSGSAPVPSISFANATRKSVEMKVVQYDSKSEDGGNLEDSYRREDATEVDPVVLNDSSYNRYLPLKVNGAQFPVPDTPLLLNRQITSVVVLAPVDYDYVEKEQREGKNVPQVHGVRFVSGDSLKELVKNPTADNFRKWIRVEKDTTASKQSVILLVTNSTEQNQEQTKEIFMYDIPTGEISRLEGELSTAFVNVAESNAESEDIEHLSQDDGTPPVTKMMSVPVYGSMSEQFKIKSRSQNSA